PRLPRLPGVRVVACADLLPERAQEAAARHGVPSAATVDKLLADPDVDIVLNLTIPAAHAEVSLAAVAAGKHVYSEKPLAVSAEDGRKLLAAAREAGVRVGAAPDTFLGAAVQTGQRLIRDGAIGEPVAAAGFMLCPGHESWHPAPDFHYQPGGGPLFDMGPYYLTALICLLGPVARVSCSARASFPERTAADGHTIDVEVDTHVAGLLEFASGAICHLVTSFDVQAEAMPHGIAVYGSTGTLTLADPNGFVGPVTIGRGDDSGWQRQPEASPYDGFDRGSGVAEMADAVRAGRPHRASGELAQHVLDTMATMLEAARTGRRLDVPSTCAPPEPLPSNP
ncbi:MAG: gfo/Idh/MocA family oxidoreductase, partial [Micromonosporaceae bacterium]|nr:gfo/Idh/MocA family oxidoreductase [Micromonosporaceae bacterium]